MKHNASYANCNVNSVTYLQSEDYSGSTKNIEQSKNSVQNCNKT